MAMTCAGELRELAAPHGLLFGSMQYAQNSTTDLAAGREMSAAADVARRGAPPAGYGMYERARVIYAPARTQIFVMPDFSSVRQASVLAAVTRVIEAAGVVWLAPLMLIVPGIAVLVGCAVFVSLDIWPGRRMPAQNIDALAARERGRRQRSGVWQ